MISSGILEVAYIGLYDWFAPDGIMMPDNGIVITKNHLFSSGLLGFLQCELAPQKNSLTAKDIGELSGKKFMLELKIVIPGSDVITHGTIQEFLNKPVIVLVKDLYDSNIVYQLGTKHLPAYILPDFSTGPDASGHKAYTLNISCTGKFVQIYAGNIKIYEPPYPNTGYPVFFSIDEITTNSLADLSAYYQSAFTYSISTIYNLIASRGNKLIQLVYRNNIGEYLSVNPDLDTSSVGSFIASIQTAIDGLIPNKGLQLYGSKLLVTDSVAQEQYLGLSVLTPILAEDGENIMGEGGETIIQE